MIFDFTTDNLNKGIDFIKSNLKDIPEYVSDSEDFSKLANFNLDAFADKKNRLYPLNTKSNIWKSAAYFYTDGHKNYSDSDSDCILSNIKVASEAFGIKKDIDSLEAFITSISEVNKTASVAQLNDDCEYALNMMDTNMYPIDNLENLLESSKNVIEDKVVLGDINFKMACYNICKKAKEKYSVNSLPLEIKQNGEPVGIDLEVFENGINRRKNANSSMNDIYDCILDWAKEGECDQFKIAKFLNTADSIIGYNPIGQSDTPVGLTFSGDKVDVIKDRAGSLVLIENIKNASSNKIYDFAFTPQQMKDAMSKIASDFNEFEKEICLPGLKDNLDDPIALSNEISKMPHDTRLKIARSILNLD